MIKAQRDARNEMLWEHRKLGWTLQKIGDKFSISRERVRQILGNTGRLMKYPEGYRRCHGPCHRVLPIADFYIYKTGKQKGKPITRCKSCLKIHSREWGKKYQYRYKVGGKYHQSTLARQSLGMAIRTGRIIKPDTCMVNKDCFGRIEGHHYLGYEKENYLKVLWLCSKHHEEADKGTLKFDAR